MATHLITNIQVLKKTSQFITYYNNNEEYNIELLLKKLFSKTQEFGLINHIEAKNLCGAI